QADAEDQHGHHHLDQRDASLTRQDLHGIPPDTPECNVPIARGAASPQPTGGRNWPMSGAVVVGKGEPDHAARGAFKALLPPATAGSPLAGEKVARRAG